MEVWVRESGVARLCCESVDVAVLVPARPICYGQLNKLRYCAHSTILKLIPRRVKT